MALGNFYPDHAHTELLDSYELSWEQQQDYPFHEDIHYGVVTFYDDNFYVFGGRSKKELINTIASFNQYSRQWKQGK